MSDVGIICLGGLLACAVGIFGLLAFPFEPRPSAPPAVVEEIETVVTYEAIASTLDRQIRTAIESNLPCAGGYGHLWDYAVTEDRSQLGVVRLGKKWKCVHCDQTSAADPRSREEQERALVSANLEEFLT